MIAVPAGVVGRILATGRTSRAGCGSSSWWCSRPRARRGRRGVPPGSGAAPHPRRRDRRRRLRHRPDRRDRAPADPGRRRQLEPRGLQPPALADGRHGGGLLGSSSSPTAAVPAMSERLAARSAEAACGGEADRLPSGRRTSEPRAVSAPRATATGERARHRRGHERPAGRHRPTRRHRHARPLAAACRRHAVPGSGRVRRHRAGRRGARRGAGHAGRRRPGRRRRHHQPAGLDDVWDRATGEPVAPGHRLAGPAHGRRLPRRWPASTASALAPNQSATKLAALLEHPRPRPRSATCASAPSTPGWRGRCRAAGST